MKLTISSYGNTLSMSTEEVKEYCKPGEGANCCSWLVLGHKGWECLCKNKPKSIVDRLSKGSMIAKRDGCDKINKMSMENRAEGEYTL